EIGDSFDPTGLVITVSYSDSSTEDVTYSTVNKNDFTFDTTTFNSAGDSQTVTVTYGEKTADITGITVNKKTPTADDFTFTAPSNLEYDRNNKEATVTANVEGMGTVTVYYDNGVGSPKTTVPTGVGEYKVKIKVDDSGSVYSGTGENYITDSEWTFTIDPFDISKCSVTLSSTEFTYNGSEQEPTITVEHGGNGLDFGRDYSLRIDGPADNVGAGEYTVKIYGKGNYSGRIEKTYTIKQAEPVLDGSVTVSSPGTVYNSTSVDDVTLSGTFKGVGAYSSETIYGTLKFADTVTGFTVGTNEYDWVFTPDSSNYTTKTGKVTIDVQEDKPSSIKVTTPTKTSYTAGDTFDPAGLAVEVTYESGATKTVAYDTDSSKFSFENNDNLSYGMTGKQSVAVKYTEGTTTVWTYIEVTVSKAVPNVSAPTGLTATYGDTLGDVDITTADDGTWAWVDDSQSVGNVGTKTFRAKFTPNDTDYSSVTKDVSVTVSPKKITPTAATASDKDYDKTTTATVQSVDFSGLVGSDSFTIGTDYTAVGVFADANAGTDKAVIVTVTLGNSGLAKNYTLSTATCAATADINKIDPVVSTPTTLTCSYKEGETPSLSNVALPAGWTWDVPAPTLNDGNNNCNATYTPADTTNYNTLHKTVTVNVVKTECTHENTTTTYSPENAKCGDPVTATVTCGDCGNTLSTSTTTKQHTCGTSYTTVTEPTCTTPGMKHIVCTECDEEKPGSETVIVALGHTGGEADCTHSAVCTRCGAEYGSPLGHSWSEGYSSDSTGHWHVCTRCGETSEAEDHVSGGAATATTPETCVVCGYEIAPATGTGGGTVTPAPTPTPTPTPSTTPGHTPSSPSGSGTGSTPSSASGPSVSGSGQKGWDSVSETIESTPEGGSVTINMNGTITLPKSVLSEIAGKDIDLVLKLNNGFEWSINGKDVTDPKNINLGANMNADNIPDTAIDTLSEGNPSIQFSLKYSGDFGFVASISVPVGAKYNGKTANLFYYNPKTKALEYVSCAAISDGKAELDFSHASDWAIVITDEPMYTAEDVTAGAGIYESSDSVIPGAGSTAVIAVILPVIAAAAFILRKKLSK
ncbi:MAG: YDG domain-containing protein, partial [Oscillospiraceae bacterium]|nr:YDG domain-containing protein [Oscillospiraceae bacterium]